MIIAYTSETGFTKKYAEMLGKKTGFEVYHIKEAPKGVKAVYFGWLFAGGVKDLKKAYKKLDVAAVCAVGMAPVDEKYPTQLKQRNKITLPFFYMQGGMDLKNLHGIPGFMMKSMVRMKRKQKNLSEDEKTMVELTLNGFDGVDEKYLTPVVEFCMSEKIYN